MDIESIKSIWAAFQEVQEKKLSPAQKKHFDKDNDGDIDDADMAMLNKKKKTDEAKTECPKCDGKGCDHCDDKGYHTEEAPADPVKKAPARKGDKSNADPAPKKVAEEADWLADLADKLDQLEAVMEKRNKQTKGATEPEGLLDKESPKSKEFVDQHKVDNTYTDFEEKGHEDASKAGKATKQSPARRGDQLNSGDKKPVK
jgi:hypothetical protein